MLSPDLVIVNGGEPPNPLIPTNTNDSIGGRIVDRLFAGLMSYDANGTPSPEVAQSVETTDNVNYRITLKPGWKFTDGSPVTAHSFVDAWNYGALATNAQLQQSFFSPIEGYDEVAAPKTPTADHHVRAAGGQRPRVHRAAQGADHRLHAAAGVHAVLPAAATRRFKDMAAFGQQPDRQRAVQARRRPDGRPGSTTSRSTWCPTPTITATGCRTTKVCGSCSTPTWTPPTPTCCPAISMSWTRFRRARCRSTSGTWATARPAARRRSTRRSTRRCGCRISAARRAGCAGWRCRPPSTGRRSVKQIFAGTRTPARDFTAASLPGFDPNIPGNDALDFDPDRARQLWAQANAISPWSGQYAIAYNADGGHQEWVDAVANSIKNMLGIDAVGAPQPTFAQFRTQITNRTIGTAFRAGWQGDYPSMLEFLAPLFVTGAGSNDVGYSNREFDAALAAAEAAPNLHAVLPAGQRRAANPVARHARCAAVGLHQRGGSVGGGQRRDASTWNGLPDYEHIVKA